MNTKTNLRRSVIGFTLALFTTITFYWLIQRSFLERDMFALAVLIPFSWFLWAAENFLVVQIIQLTKKVIFYVVLLFLLALLTEISAQLMLFGADTKISFFNATAGEEILKFLFFYGGLLAAFKHSTNFSDVISNSLSLNSSLVLGLQPSVVNAYQETNSYARQSARTANNALFTMAAVTIIGLFLAVFAGHITARDRNVFEHTTQLQQKVQQQEIELFKLAALHERSFRKAINHEDCKKANITDIQEQNSVQRYCKNSDELDRLRKNRNKADELQTEFLLKQDHASNATTNYLISTGFLRLGIVLTMLLVLHMLFKIFLNASQSLATYRAISNSLLTSTLTNTMSLDELKKFYDVKFFDESQKPVDSLADILGKVVSVLKAK